MEILKYIQNHASVIAEVGVAWLFIQNFLKAIQDAVDAQPVNLKPPFGKIIYYMQAVGGYLFLGNRIQKIGGNDESKLLADNSKPAASSGS